MGEHVGPFPCPGSSGWWLRRLAGSVSAADEQGRHGEVRWGEAEICVDGRGSSAEGQAVLLAH